MEVFFFFFLRIYNMYAKELEEEWITCPPVPVGLPPWGPNDTALSLPKPSPLVIWGFLRRFQHCTGHITTGSWKGRGNQYI